jgi:hypothetical protein
MLNMTGYAIKYKSFGKNKRIRFYLLIHRKQQQQQQLFSKLKYNVIPHYFLILFIYLLSTLLRKEN